MAAQIKDNTKFTGVLLPETFKPIHYNLSLKPNLVDFTFEGHVDIEFKNDKPSNSIVVHAKDLVISEGFCSDSAAKNELKTVYYGDETETAVLEFAGSTPKVGTISLKFKGTLNDNMKGFYKTTFKVGEATVYAATTQFESTDARRCFPCKDEPAAKATFTVELTYEESITAGDQQLPMVGLSNMPVVSTKSENGLVTLAFDKTPIMSTYLLAFIVGPFEFIEHTDGKRPIRVYTKPGKKDQGQFAMDVACKTLPFFEEYFNVEYPLPKMDLIAIPDFASGAMENWGLVTYREACLLFDDKKTSTDYKQFIAICVVHELAHQWFGNLVTMQWWTHLWLNEGFASFMEFIGVDKILPEYDIWSQFATDAYGLAMQLDSLHNSHPIEVPVNHPSEIDEIFDTISYKKGASVIRMLYDFIGDDSFRKGMNKYLTKFAYQNALTEDLWDELEAASNKPVRKLMSGWTSQKGYPWLSISENGDESFTITQSKFTADGTLPQDEAHLQWMIPISVIKSSDPKKSIELCIIDSKSTQVKIDGVGADGWFKLNAGSIGLYRTAYPQSMIEKLKSAISSKVLPPMDRLGIQSDMHALCQAGKVSTVALLNLLDAYKGENNFTVWKSIDASVGQLLALLTHTGLKDKFKLYGRDLYSVIMKELTWSPKPNEAHCDGMFRAIIIRRLVSLGEPSVVAEAKRLFESGTIRPDLKGAVYRVAAEHGDEKTFERLLEIYRTADADEEKCRVLAALGFTKDSKRLERVIEFFFSDEVRNQDRATGLCSIGASDTALAFKILQERKDFLRKAHERHYLMGRIIECSTQNFATEEMYQKVHKFFEDNKFEGSERAIQQSLETIKINIKWLQRDTAALETYFK